jgi:hypothetical protein
MSRRKRAIDDETLRREAGTLADEVLLLPVQVLMICGLSQWQLKEHGRTRPPKPPHPEPRANPDALPWYSLGACRYYRVWLQEQEAANAVMAKRKSETRFSGFASWLNTADLRSDPWPCAVVGPYARPVDFWATVRGEVAIDHKDACKWLSLGDYLDLRTESARLEAEAVDRAARVATTVKRVKRAPSGEGLPPTKIIRD